MRILSALVDQLVDDETQRHCCRRPDVVALGSRRRLYGDAAARARLQNLRTAPQRRAGCRDCYRRRLALQPIAQPRDDMHAGCARLLESEAWIFGNLGRVEPRSRISAIRGSAQFVGDAMRQSRRNCSVFVLLQLHESVVTPQIAGGPYCDVHAIWSAMKEAAAARTAYDPDEVAPCRELEGPRLRFEERRAQPGHGRSSSRIPTIRPNMSATMKTPARNTVNGSPKRLRTRIAEAGRRIPARI